MPTGAAVELTELMDDAELMVAADETVGAAIGVGAPCTCGGSGGPFGETSVRMLAAARSLG
eukprot:407363-Prymnesium_polylepis.2